MSKLKPETYHLEFDRASRKLTMASWALIAVPILSVWPAMAAESGASCAGEPDDRQRLACYDRVFGAVTASPEHMPIQDEVTIAEPVANTETEHTSSVLSQVWELGQNDKRGTFTVRTYQPNFLLPAHYTSHVNRFPSSPTQGVGNDQFNYRPIDAKLQISLRAKMAENLFLPGADLWFAYTQRSLWQVWDRKDSSPFRSNDYQPEAIYVVPVPENFSTLPWGWSARMLQFGIAHQSNGQSDPLSRSWNRIYMGAGLERENFTLMVKANHRLDERGKDDNPDLTDYIGHGEMTLLWFPGKSTVSLTWKTNLDSFSRGSLQLDMTHPVFDDQPSGLRWYAQLFSGYGETLLDYNHRQTSLGLGVSLFQF
jgi:phospholipase A1